MDWLMSLWSAIATIGSPTLWAVLADVFTVIGIGAAAWWFVLRRIRYPRARVKQSAMHRAIDEHRVWLRVTLEIENTGEVLLRIGKAEATVQQVLPLVGTAGRKISEGEEARPDGCAEIDWPYIDKRLNQSSDFEVEPGEADTLDWEFILETPPQTVLIYTFLANRAKKPRGGKLVGWSATTTYDFSLHPNHLEETLMADDKKLNSGGSEQRQNVQKTVSEKVVQNQKTEKTITQKLEPGTTSKGKSGS